MWNHDFIIFQSSEFRFGFVDLTDDQPRSVNEYRTKPENGRYIDKDAAKEATFSVEVKKTFTEHRFEGYFEYGANIEGYWGLLCCSNGR